MQPLSSQPISAQVAGYPAQYFSSQPNLPPLPVKRVLEADELALLSKGQNQWTGKWFPHLGTELWQLMSSPEKQASAWGHITGVVGGMVGGALANVGHIGHPDFSAPQTWGYLALGSALGLPSALLAQQSADQNNGNLKDMWQRLPYRPTYRDYLSDPVANDIAPLKVTQAKDVMPNVLQGLATVALVRGVTGQKNFFNSDNK